MKITFNIEKKHLIVLMIIIGVVAAGIAIASTWDNSQSHDTLWTRYIKGRNSNDITFYDDITIYSGKGITLGGVKKTTWPSSGQDCLVDVTNSNMPLGYSPLQGKISGYGLITPDICTTKSCGDVSLLPCSSTPQGSWITVSSSSASTGQKCESYCIPASPSNGCPIGQARKTQSYIQVNSILYCK